MYDVVIIGGGPAAVGAAVYVARKKMNAAVVAAEFGGQSMVSASIENWIGDISLSGFELAQRLETHVRAQKGLMIFSPDTVRTIVDLGSAFRVETENGHVLETRGLIVATGSKRRRLGVPGEAKFEGKGVVFCSTCDAPLFGGKTVAVVGGGNAGLEAVVDLLPYAENISLLVRSDALKGDQVTQDEIRARENVKIVFNSTIEEIMGQDYVTGIAYRDRLTDERKEIAVDGVFVEIGAVPNSDLVKGLANLNEAGEVIIDHRTGATSHPRIWAAGDVTDEMYKQNNISVGDAVKAALSAYGALAGARRHSPSSQAENE